MAQQRTAAGSAVDASPFTLPATRMPVNARGLALGVVAAAALVFALSWAQTSVVPLLVVTSSSASIVGHLAQFSARCGIGQHKERIR